MESSWIRLSGILPPNSTYVLSRAASDLALQNCADLVEPDDFLKHNGDDGFKITHIGYLPESLSEDTTAWLKMSLTLDAIGYADNDQDLPGMLAEFPRQLGTISYLEIWMYVVVMGEIGTLLEDV